MHSREIAEHASVRHDSLSGCRPCRTHMEQIVYVLYLFHDSGDGGDVDTQAAGTSLVHSRTDERIRHTAILRRNEGCPGSCLEIGHPSAHHGSRRAGVHSSPAQPCTRPGGDKASRGLFAQPSATTRLFPGGHRGKSRQAAACAGRTTPAIIKPGGHVLLRFRAGHGAHRGGRAHLGYPEQYP